MCGFIGVIGSDSAVHEIYDGLIAIQHRGQDAAGILTYDGRFHVKKGEGLVRDIFSSQNFARLKGGIGVGHVRYPTVGSGGGEDAQPFTVNFPFGIVMAHNGNVANYDDLKDDLAGNSLRVLYSGCDVEVILNVFAGALAKEATAGFDLRAYHAAVATVFRSVRGAYSVVGMIAGHGLFAFREPYGIKPIAVGRRRTEHGFAYAVASESVVLTTLDYEVLPWGAPGEALFVDLAGNVTREQVMESRAHPCVFEYVYFARPDSVLWGRNVHAVRKALGHQLAREYPVAADLVIAVPDSGVGAALGFSEESGLPYDVGLVRNHYVGRTFIEPQQGIRHFGVKVKLNPNREVLDGRRVVVVDDSIVRGTTSRKIVKMIRAAGAREVHVRISSPPIQWPCYYGIDTPTRRELIGASHRVEEIQRYLGADSLGYLSLEGMLKATGSDPHHFCHACFTGQYQVGFESEELAQLKLFEP
jgi:amidophosphoribosyltransferase